MVFGTQVFGVTVIDAVLNGTDYAHSLKSYLILATAIEKLYAHSLKSYLILATAIEKLKWEAFSKHIDPHEFSKFSKTLKAFHIALASKNRKESKSSYHVCLNQCQVIKHEFETFSKTCSERSDIRRHWDGILTLIGLLQDLVAAKTGKVNWETGKVTCK